MEEYRKYMDSQHAPRELVERTLARVREEEKRFAVEALWEENGDLNGKNGMQALDSEDSRYGNEHSRRNRSRGNLYRRIYIGAAGLAACLVIVISVFANRPRLSYQPVSASMLRSGLTEGNREELTIEEYEAYLGVNLFQWLEGYECSDSKIYVSYGEDAQTLSRSIQKDEGTFYLDVDGHVVILKLSQSGLELPEGLLTGEAGVINGIVVYAGEEAESGTLFAAYHIGEIQYYLIGNDMSKRQFERLIKQLLQEER